MSQRSQLGLSPIEHAQRLLTDLNIKSMPVYPRKIAKEMGILVWEKEADSGYDGYLICANGTWGIMVNGSIRSRTRKRFTVAHELGHYCISNHTGASYQCFRKDIGTFDSAARNDEREANEFAAELLMPDGFFKEDVRQRDIGLKTIDFLAARYGTSISCTAIKYARSSHHPCAIVVSERGKIKYFAYSESFRRRKYLYLSRNAPLRDGSYAKKLFDAGFKISGGQGEISLSAWSGDTTDPEVVVMEDSKCLPAIKQVLSLIWFKEKRSSKPQPIAHVLVE